MILNKENRALFLNLTVIVVALGYFVDIFDLTLFNMVRRQSLLDIGIPEVDLVSKGLLLLNIQMVGMLLGGVFWGQLGDRKGRLTTLFLSIILYSIANLLNAFAATFEQYALLRFIAGVGLAGELGVGITLVAELLPKEKRGLGTMFVASIGVLGAVLGGIFVEIFSWRVCYAIGGMMGLLLLLLRVSVKESQLFKKVEGQEHVNRGQFLDFFKSKSLFRRLFLCILVGTPFWFIAGILMPFSPELAANLQVTDVIYSSRAVAISYLGLAIGDFLSGWLSQVMRSRKKALYVFHASSLILLLVFFFTVGGRSQWYFYSLCLAIGISAGFWALFVTIAAESFGTNIRSTAATSIPNFVRAAVVPMTLLLLPLRDHFTYQTSTLIVGVLSFSLALWAVSRIDETFGKSLDYTDSAKS